MVQLVVTDVALSAIQRYCTSFRDDADAEATSRRDRLSNITVGEPIEHTDLLSVSRRLLRICDAEDIPARACRIDALLRGTRVYRAPPQPKPEPSPAYKALMRRLREEEEQRQYDRMTNPAPEKETFRNRFPNASLSFDPSTSHGQTTAANEVDDMTFDEVNRQMILIINVLVSVIACSVAIWVVARHWSVPQRLGLSMFGSGLVAAAEVAIYFGYIMRIETAKTLEVKKQEVKSVMNTWVIDPPSNSSKKKQ